MGLIVICRFFTARSKVILCVICFVLQFTVPRRPDKVSRLGYRPKQGYCICRIGVRRRGRKRPVAKGCTYGKPKSHRVNELKPCLCLQSRHKLDGLRLLNSVWVASPRCFISTTTKTVVILRSTGVVHAVHKHRDMRGITSAGKRSRQIGKGYKSSQTMR